MPNSVLDSTGRTFLNGILSTIQHRIERQLIEDYRDWAASTQGLQPVARSSNLRSNLAQ